MIARIVVFAGIAQTTMIVTSAETVHIVASVIIVNIVRIANAALIAIIA